MTREKMNKEVSRWMQQANNDEREMNKEDS